MIKYTIHTENKNLKGIKNVLHNILGYVGYTITECGGAWKGKQEKALKIEILSPHALNVALKEVAVKIRDLNKQEVVLLTAERVEAELV